MMENVSPEYKPGEKLISDQTTKQKYILYFRYLKFRLQTDLRVTKLQTAYNSNNYHG